MTNRPVRLLVSVRTAAEAQSALAGGADIIDIKEPNRGPMGQADAAIIQAITATVGSQAPVSAALGDLNISHPPQILQATPSLAVHVRPFDFSYQRQSELCRLLLFVLSQ